MSNGGLCHWSHSDWWGTGAQRQKLLQCTGKPQAEGGPEPGLEGEAGASAVLEGSTGRCVQNNWLGFCIWLGKFFAGQEECMRVWIKK